VEVYIAAGALFAAVNRRIIPHAVFGISVPRLSEPVQHNFKFW
jgi:hypothetical protein